MAKAQATKAKRRVLIDRKVSEITRREALIDDLGNICCSKCGETLDKEVRDYGVASDGEHLFFIRRCKAGHGNFVYYANTDSTIRFNSETIVYQLIINKEDNKVENKNAMNKKTNEVSVVKVMPDNSYVIGEGDAAVTLTAKAFFKEYKLVNAEPTAESKANAANPAVTKKVKAVAENDNGAGKPSVEPKKKEENLDPEYEYQPVIENNRAGKPILTVSYNIDTNTVLVTKENTSGSIYLVHSTTDLGGTEDIVIPAKTKKVIEEVKEMVDGAEVMKKVESIVEVEPARTETRPLVKFIESKKGSVEEVVKAYVGYLGAAGDAYNDMVTLILKNIRQTRKHMKTLPDIVEFYGK